MSYKKPKEPGLIPSKSTLGKKTRNPGYEPGNHWVICDRCGFATRANDARITWDNLVVCPADWEPRHPQDFVRGREDKIAPSEPIRPEGPDQFVESPAPNLVAPIIVYTDIGDGNFYFDGWADYPEYSYLVLDADTGEVIGECEVELGEEYYFWYEVEMGEEGPSNFQVIVTDVKGGRVSPPSNTVGYLLTPVIDRSDETEEAFSFKGVAKHPNYTYRVFDGGTDDHIGNCIVYYDVLEGEYLFSFETDKSPDGPFEFYVKIYDSVEERTSLSSNTVGYEAPVLDGIIISTSGPVMIELVIGDPPAEYSFTGGSWVGFTGSVTLNSPTGIICVRVSTLGTYNYPLKIGRSESSSGFEGIISWGEEDVMLELGTYNPRNFFVPDHPPTGKTSLERLFISASGFNDPNVIHWDTSNIKSMRHLFSGASSFNQPIGGWDTSSVEVFHSTFLNARSFNQDISGWDVSSVLGRSEMTSMFEGAQAFNQDLSGWCVSNISTKPARFDLTTPSWDTVGRLPVWGTCPMPPVIGEYYKGGVYIGDLNVESFYYPEDVGRYRIILGLPESETSLVWKTSNTNTAGTFSDTNGADNTEKALGVSSVTHQAAAYCDNYENDGFSDWYLPSWRELYDLRANISSSATLNIQKDWSYWASTSYGTANAYAVTFTGSSGGSQYNFPKNSSRFIRPCRRERV